MAKIACEYSEHVILTSDNPRSEDPEVILEEMLAGVDGTQIRKTISSAERGGRMPSLMAPERSGRPS